MDFVPLQSQVTSIDPAAGSTCATIGSSSFVSRSAKPEFEVVDSLLQPHRPSSGTGASSPPSVLVHAAWLQQVRTTTDPSGADDATTAALRMQQQKGVVIASIIAMNLVVKLLRARVIVEPIYGQAVDIDRLIAKTG